MNRMAACLMPTSIHGMAALSVSGQLKTLGNACVSAVFLRKRIGAEMTYFYSHERLAQSSLLAFFQKIKDSFLVDPVPGDHVRQQAGGENQQADAGQKAPAYSGP